MSNLVRRLSSENSGRTARNTLSCWLSFWFWSWGPSIDWVDANNASQA